MEKFVRVPRAWPLFLTDEFLSEHCRSFFLHRILKSGITLPAEIKVPFKISKSIQKFHIKIFFTLIINFVVVFLAYYPTVFLFLPPYYQVICPKFGYTFCCGWGFFPYGKPDSCCFVESLAIWNYHQYCAVALLQTQWNGNEGKVLVKINRKLVSLLVQQLPLKKSKRCLQSSGMVVVYNLQQI